MNSDMKAQLRELYISGAKVSTDLSAVMKSCCAHSH